MDFPVKIKAIGNYFPLDEQGHIFNDTSKEKIAEHWQPAIAKIIDAYQKYLTVETIHSIYLRGSVGRGWQVDGFSDIDTFALVHSPNLKWKTPSWIDQVDTSIENEFPFVNGVEMSLTSYATNLTQTYPQLAMLIKTQSLLLFGKQLEEQLPNYQPGIQMALHYRWIATDIETFKSKEQVSAAEFSALMKLFLRVGFELAMPKTNRYTNDLYLCYQSFSEIYPQKAAEMKNTLLYYLNPEKALPFGNDLINDFGAWLLDESVKCLKS